MRNREKTTLGAVQTGRRVTDSVHPHPASGLQTGSRQLRETKMRVK